jgi:hypothetical protein
MRHLTRSWFWTGSTVLLCLVCCNRTKARAEGPDKLGAAPAPSPAPEADDPLKRATDARTRAQAARDRAEAMAKDFAAPLATAPAAVKADAEGARQAAKAAGDSAVAAADVAISLAKSLKSPPDAAALVYALSVAYAALTATERAEAAEAWARSAHEDARAQVDSDAAGLAKQADGHRKDAQGHETQAADCDKKGGEPKDVLALRTAALAREAEIYRNLAASFARRVVAPPLPAEGQFFKIKDADPAKAPQSLGLTYLLSPRQLGFHLVDGAPEGSLKLTIVPKDRSNPPPRITLTFTFKHEQSGTLTIPRTERIRPLLDANGQYSLTDDHRKILAHDFIRVLDEIDQTFSAGNAIKPHDVTVTIIHDDGFTIDTLAGWLRFDPKLTNAR